MSIYKILKKIGVVTLKEHERKLEELRNKSEEFAKDYLDASRGVTLGTHGGFVNGGIFQAGGAVIGSMVVINNVTASHLVVAPWAKHVVINGLVATGSGSPKNVRAMVRVMRRDEGIEGSEVGTNHQRP